MLCLVTSCQNLSSLFIRSFPARIVLQIRAQFSVIMGLWMLHVVVQYEMLKQKSLWADMKNVVS